MPMRNMLTTLPAANAEISLAASRRIFKASTFLNTQTASLFLQCFFYSSLNNIKIQFSNLRRRYITPFLPVTTNIETTYQNIPSKNICTCSCIRQLTKGVSKTPGPGWDRGRVRDLSFHILFLCHFFFLLTQILISRNLHPLCMVTIFSDVTKTNKI